VFGEEDDGRRVCSGDLLPHFQSGYSRHVHVEDEAGHGVAFLKERLSWDFQMQMSYARMQGEDLRELL
jgi:hypothetical protein